jgi:hypothetical protein
MQNEKYTYKIKDFYTSSVIRALRIPLVRVDRTYSICTFVFDITSEKARSLIDNYWNKNLQVDALTLIEAINELKTRIHVS